MQFKEKMKHNFYALLVFIPLLSCGQHQSDESAFIRNNYSKIERLIPMRDGKKLFTAIYIPKDEKEKYPILMLRTPYSCEPYGEDQYPLQLIGPNKSLMHEKYIFVYQDVRGRFKSEGQFEEMTPAKDVKQGGETDESSDTYDTIEWLLHNIKNNNGNVGIWGISYPGFYASASLPNAHPAIKAVSPQAPVTDEFIGDDANHNGAFFLLDNFDFMNGFDGERIDSGKAYNNVFDVDMKDVYSFFLKQGTVKHTNEAPYYNHKSKIWNEYLQHDTYDQYWQDRNIRPHLKNIKPAVLVVGGWFDAEDLFGALRTYEAIEQQSPGNNNRLVMGPWTHGAWSATKWNRFGTLDFGQNTSQYFNDSMQTPFFNYYLKNKGRFPLPEATVFETGTNTWKQYDTWPPANKTDVQYYLQQSGSLATTPSQGFDQYVSDPANPVPYINGQHGDRVNEYMVADQRFAARRPDVLAYQTEVLKKSVTVTGRLHANLFVSTTGTDADFIVKVIDVLPDTAAAPAPRSKGLQLAGYQRLVRAEVFRGKFRNSYEKPTPFEPGKIEEIQFDLNEIAHTFLPGHRIMVQVQSSWFPLVDRNPQKFMRIPDATDTDFQRATIKVYHDPEHPSSVTLPVLNQ